MKKLIRPDLLPHLMLGISGIGMSLRLLLFATGIDEKGFLKPWHPADILLWVFSLAVVGFLFWYTHSIKGQGRYQDNFPASIPGAVGCIAAATGIFITALGELMIGGDSIATAGGILGVLCAPALVLAGYNRYCGTRTSFLIHTLLSVYFITRLISQYRLWSADPQLQEYCFQLLACVGLMLTACHRASFDLRMGKRQSYAFFNLVTFYFCCLSIPYCEQKLFYIVTACWLITNLCSLGRLTRRAAAPVEPVKLETEPAALEPLPDLSVQESAPAPLDPIEDVIARILSEDSCDPDSFLAQLMAEDAPTAAQEETPDQENSGEEA